MSTFKLQPPYTYYSADEVIPLPKRLATWTLTREEAATLWYALVAYKTHVVKDATDTNTSQPENEMFLYDIAAKCAKLMFELRDDHTNGNDVVVRTWLDTD